MVTAVDTYPALEAVVTVVKHADKACTNLGNHCMDYGESEVSTV